MTIEEILHGENQYVEFKETRPEGRESCVWRRR